MSARVLLDLIDDAEREGAREHRDNRLRPLTIAELRAMAAPQWLVRDTLHCRSLSIVWGASGSGKTFLVLDLSISIATGKHWFGKRTVKGGVIYIAGEGRITPRVAAYCKHHQIDDSDLDGLRVVSTNVDLLDPEGDLEPLVVALTDASKGMGGVLLVVLDTLNAMMPGGDENSSAAMGVMIASARKIMAELGCAVVIVHHGGKDESRGARGHSSLKAAVDTEIHVEHNTADRSASIEKQRDGEAGARVGFRLHPVDLGPSADPDSDPDEREHSCIVEPAECVAPTGKPTSKRNVALEALHEALQEFGECHAPTSTLPKGVHLVTMAQWQSRWLLRTGNDYKDTDGATSAFRRQRLALIKGGQVFVSDPYVWLG